MDRPRTSDNSNEAVGADVIDVSVAAVSSSASGAGSRAGDSASVSVEFRLTLAESPALLPAPVALSTL